jgi:hypothetical protein
MLCRLLTFISHDKNGASYKRRRVHEANIINNFKKGETEYLAIGAFTAIKFRN